MRAKLVSSMMILGLTLLGFALVVVNGSLEEAGAGGSRVPPPAGSAGPPVGAIALNPTTVAPGTKVPGTITLIGPAPSGGAVVNMRSSNPDVAVVPATVEVPPGFKVARFVVQTADWVPTQLAVDISAQVGSSPPATVRLFVTQSLTPGTSGGWDLKQNKKQ